MRFIQSLIVVLLSLQIASAQTYNRVSYQPQDDIQRKAFKRLSTDLVGELQRKSQGLSGRVLYMAFQSALCAGIKGNLNPADTRYLGVIDYSLPSTARRFWLFDLKSRSLILNDYIAHGKNSGENYASVFSNEPGSLTTSLGLFRAGNPYVGKHGKSLRLHGLDENFNDKAYERAIVMHGAPYVSESFIEAHKRLGRSWGCPALRPSLSSKVIDLLRDGGLLFAYGRDEQWINSSSLLTCADILS